MAALLHRRSFDLADLRLLLFLISSLCTSTPSSPYCLTASSAHPSSLPLNSNLLTPFTPPMQLRGQRAAQPDGGRRQLQPRAVWRRAVGCRGECPALPCCALLQQRVGWGVWHICWVDFEPWLACVATLTAANF